MSRIKPKLVLIRGVPGCGKSTLAQLLRKQFPDFDWFESDQYFETKSGFKWNPNKVREAHVQCMNKTFASLRRGRSVIVSNTLCGNWSMRHYFAMARLTNAFVEIINLRHEFGSVHDIPEVSMQKFRDSWEEVNESELYGLKYNIIKDGAKLLENMRNEKVQETINNKRSHAGASSVRQRKRSGARKACSLAAN